MPVFRSYAPGLVAGVSVSLVVDVGRLATTRDRPSALSASPPPFLSPPRLGGHRERVGHHPRSLLFPLLVLMMVVVVAVASANVCESEFVSRVASGRTISRDRGVGYQGWKVKRRRASALKDMPLIYINTCPACANHLRSLEIIRSSEIGTLNVIKV